MTKEKEEYPDPFKKMAEDIMETGRELVKKTRKQRPKCPSCKKKLWKKNDGTYSCPNQKCDRDVVTPEEIASRKIVQNFLG
jgi:transposase-like protein